MTKPNPARPAKRPDGALREKRRLENGVSAMLFAEVGFWDWMMKMTDPSFIAAVGVIIGLYFKHRYDSAGQQAIKEEVISGNKITEAVMPAVTAKVDSAIKENNEAAAEVKKETQATATRLAGANALANAQVIEVVKEMKTAIKGDDGTCISAKVEEHGRMLSGLDSRLTNVEHAVTEGLAILREMQLSRGGS